MTARQAVATTRQRGSVPPFEHGLSVADRCRWAMPFVGIGAASIVAGGLVAAVTRPTHFDLGPWVAAFLVLVVGVAQIALGAGQAWLADRRLQTVMLGGEALAWNLGAAATLVGSVRDTPIVTTAGAVATVVALAWFVAPVGKSTSGPRWARSVYLSGVAVLLVSTPVGVLLAWTGSR